MSKYGSALLAALFISASAAQAQGACEFREGWFDRLYLKTGGSYVLIRISKTESNLSDLKNVCEQAHAAIRCDRARREEDRVERIKVDLGPALHQNYGSQYAVLVVGALPKPVAEFAIPNYTYDQNREFRSLHECEVRRAEITAEITERAQAAIEASPQEQDLRKRELEELRQETRPLDLGPKY